VKFNLYTDAKVTAISEDNFLTLANMYWTIWKLFYGPAKHPLKVKGNLLKVLNTTMLAASYMYIHNNYMYVACKDLKNNLLELPMITVLNFIAKLQSIYSKNQSWNCIQLSLQVCIL